MLKNYDELDKNEKNTTHQANLIEIGMSAKLPSEDNLIVNKRAKKRLKEQGEHSSLKNQLIRSFVYTKIEVPNERYYRFKFTRFFYRLVQMPLFGSVILFCILLNTIFLSLERHPMPQSEKNAYNNVNYFFTSVFAIEVILKVIGLSPRKFIMDKFNIFDSIIVLVSVVELFFSSGSGGVSALRAFRLFRIFKLFRTGNLRVLLDSIAYTMGTIGNYVILLGLFIYVYSLLGMQFFAGKLKFNEDGYYDPNGEVARANFDTIYWAAITVFEILIGDNWNQVMFDCIKAVGILSSIYFISLILFGSIIMLNLFLAILLGNFDKARTFWLKKSIFEMFETAIENKYSLNKAISIILGDVNKSVREELLIHDPKDIFRINGRLMIINRKLMENDADAQDKLAHYDKVAVYEDEYQPIIEQHGEGMDEGDEPESEEEQDISADKLKVNVDEPRNSQINLVQELDLLKVNKPDESMEEQKKPLDESADDLMSTKKRAISNNIEPVTHNGLKPTLVINTAGKSFSKTKPRKLNTEDIKEEQKFVTLGTPRQKIEGLDEIRIDSANPLLPHNKITKSATFDYRSHEQPESPDSGLDLESDESEDDDEVVKEKEQYFAEEMLIETKSSSWVWKAINYARHSSLCIFHRDWRFRKYLIALVVSPETYQEYLNKKKEDSPFDTFPNESMTVKDFVSPSKSQKLEKLDDLEENKIEDVSKRAKSFMRFDENDKFGQHSQMRANKTLRISDSQVYEMIKFKNKSRHPSKYFDWIIIILILLSSLLLIADSPLNDPSSRYSKVLGNIDFVFTFLFALEAAIKIIALGFFWSSIPAQPYIRNGWNMLDFTVVMASLVDFFFLIQETDKVDTGQLKSLKALRALRALRPLRMISRNEGMRLVVNALFASIPSMTNVLIVCLLFILIFASTGISFFAGRFYYCSDEDTDRTSDGFVNLGVVDNKHDCNNVGGQWVNRESNFDNIFSASLTLFEMMTTEGWLRVMYNGIDARGIGLEPKKNNNIVMALFFIAFMVVGSMLIFNLFVGVVIDNFNKIKTNEELGNMFVTESQKKWIEIQRIIMRKKLKLQEQKPTKGIRLKCLNFAKSKGFEWFITICILANTIVMSIKYARMNETYETTLEYFNYVFAAIFNFEAIVKIVGYGKSYFYYSWNKFDLLIVIGTDIGLVMNLVNAGINVSTVATVVRAFRIMRIFRLVKSSQNMRIILDTIAHIMPQVTNIMSLVFLLLFIYAVLGLNLFATVMYQEYYNERANFRSFGDAILLLLRCLTGEDWNLIMKELAIQGHHNGVRCVDDQSYEEMQENGILGCGNNISYLYFISYMILLSMVIMNLSVAAVIEGLAEASKENMGIVSGDQIDFLIEKWKDYDTNASGLISYQDLIFLLYEVPPPLGLGKFTTYYSDQKYAGDPALQSIEDEEKKEDLKNMNHLGLQDRYMIHEDKKIYIKKSDAIKIFNDFAIPLYEQNVHFKDVAKALVEKIFKKNKLSYDLTGKIKNRLNKQWEGKYNTLKKSNPVEGIDTGVVEAGKAILKFYKRTKGHQDISSFKKGKSIFMKYRNKANTSQINKPRLSLKEEYKFKEEIAFSSNRIEKFIEKCDSEEIKQDRSFDAFRILMNDKNLDYDQDLFTTNNRDKKEDKFSNQFTWFRDPNFKIEDYSSEEETKNNQFLNDRSTLKPSIRTPHVPRKSHGLLDMSKLDFSKRFSGNIGKEKSLRPSSSFLHHPKSSQIFERRERSYKSPDSKTEKL